MSLQFTPSVVNVISSFQRVGLNQDQLYNKDQLFSALDKMSGQVYDRDVASQLFEQCQTNQKGQVGLEDFAQVIIEADKILKKKIAQTEQQVQQYNQDQRDCEQAAREESHTQQLNSLGVDKDSQLSIAIKNANNIQYQDFQNSFLVISVDRIEQTTPISTGSDKYNPQYNNQLTFQIQSGQEEINIQLYVSDRYQQKHLIGNAHLDLGSMYDQQVHTLSLQLMNERGIQTSTVIHIETQWIHNKLKYHQDLLEKYDSAIQTLKVDIDDYKRDLLVIQQAFIDPGVRNNLQQSLNPQQQQQSIPIIQQQQGQGSAFLYQQQQQQQQQQQSQQNKSLPMAQQFRPNLQSNSEISEELYYGFVLYLTMLILSIFQCFARPAFFDLILAMLFMIIVVRDCFEPTYIKLVGGINVASIFLDIVWIVYYKNWWDGTDKSLPTWGEAGDSVLRMSIVFCIFNLILKSALCYFIYHYYKASVDQQQLTFKFWQFEFTVGLHKQNLFTHQGLLN